jgi:hypothetical protein
MTKDFKESLLSADDINHRDGDGNDGHSSDESSDPLLILKGTEEVEVVTERGDDSTKKRQTKKPVWVTGERLSTLLQRYLQLYGKLTATSIDQDRLLKVLQWSLYLIATRVGHQHSHSASSVAAAAWLKKLSLEVSFARYATRLLGLPIALEAAINDSWTAQAMEHASSGSTSKLQTLYKWIGKILAYSMVAYYPTEHAAYALWMRPPPATAAVNDKACAAPVRNRWWENPNTWSYISCRFWLTYVVAELVQCMLQLHEQGNRKKHLLLHAAQKKKTDNNKNDGDDSRNSEGEEMLASLQSSMTNTRLQLLRNVFFLFPCINWSLTKWDTKPWLSTETVNTLMWAEAMTCLYQTVRNKLQ